MSATAPTRKARPDLTARRLDNRQPFRTAIPCKICGDKAFGFDIVDFNKYCSQEDFYSFGFSGINVEYHRCRLCKAIFTDFFDEWTAADFSRHVYNEDYIKVDSEYVEVRPRFVARDMVGRWGDCRKARVLDYGSGAGVFADELRRQGYADVEAYDPFSSPEKPTGTFDIVTCFEVIEHTPSPVATVRDMCSYLKPDGCIIVSQTLQPDNIDQLRGNWWYIGPRNGHICTYTADTMALLAQTCGLTFHNGEGPYGFSRPEMSPFARRALATMGRPHYFAPLLAPAAQAGARDVDRRCWDKAERTESGSFRWSIARRLDWPAPAMPHTPATLRAVIPFSDRITPEFLDDIYIARGWSRTPFRVEGATLVADLDLKSPLDAIRVTTPRPITPRQLKGEDDDRPLGLAVLSQP